MSKDYKTTMNGYSIQQWLPHICDCVCKNQPCECKIIANHFNLALTYSVITIYAI